MPRATPKTVKGAFQEPVFILGCFWVTNGRLGDEGEHLGGRNGFGCPVIELNEIVWGYRRIEWYIHDCARA
jgi:hypothetical protein